MIIRRFIRLFTGDLNRLGEDNRRVPTRRHQAVEMFYEGGTVQSRYHGLGKVTMFGDAPRVRFLDGWECCVAGDTITIVPLHVYDAEVRNRLEIERWLSWRITGCANDAPLSLPSPKTDLAKRMVDSVG